MNAPPPIEPNSERTQPGGSAVPVSAYAPTTAPAPLPTDERAVFHNVGDVAEIRRLRTAIGHYVRARLAGSNDLLHYWWTLQEIAKETPDDTGSLKANEIENACSHEQGAELIERLASDSRALMEERDGLTAKVCELLRERQQAQHERDCMIEKLAELRAASIKACSDMGCSCDQAPPDPVPPEQQCPMCVLERSIHVLDVRARLSQCPVLHDIDEFGRCKQCDFVQPPL